MKFATMKIADRFEDALEFIDERKSMIKDGSLDMLSSEQLNEFAGHLDDVLIGLRGCVEIGYV